MRDFFGNIINALIRQWIWILSALGLVALGFFYNYLARQGPRQVETTEVATVTITDPAARRLSGEITALEKTYRASTNPNSAEALAVLNEAIEKQRALVKMLGGADQGQNVRLGQLERTRADVNVQDTLSKIEQLTREAQLALAGGRIEEADPKFHEALRLQREVNASSVSLELKDTVRETVLKQAVDNLEVEPLKRELTDALATAKAAAAAQRSSEARVAYIRARSLQARINRDFSGTPYASMEALQTLEAEIDSLGTAAMRADSEAAERAGDAALAAGRGQEAAELLGKARDLQVQINEKFKRSQFVAEDRAEALEVRRQTAASLPTSDLLDALDGTIAVLLRRHAVAEAVPKITEATRAIGRLFTAFPKSTRLNSALKEKLDFLDSRRGALAEIHQHVSAGLLPVPGATGGALLKTEVRQSLYSLVMGTNPSRRVGAELPVDSVNWTDVQGFCARLSWLLGATVRLPTEAEFRAALSVSPSPGTWSFANSNGTTQPAGGQAANEAGFFDLLGNVGEWLAAEAAAGDAPVAGGSYLDSPPALLRVPVEKRAKDDRGRHIGFRFVVELPPEEMPPTPPRPSAVGAGAGPDLPVETAAGVSGGNATKL